MTVGGAGVDGEDDSWDFGTGAGFYVDATQEGWNKNYKMYSYVTDELPQLVFKEYPIDETKMSITGHSMGTYTTSQHAAPAYPQLHTLPQAYMGLR